MFPQKHGSLYAVLLLVLDSILTTLGVFLTNRSNREQLKLQLAHQERVQKENLSIERFEELYVLISHWGNGIFGNGLYLVLVMKGELSYSQYLDEIINAGENRKTDFSRMEMIIDVYGQSVNQQYQELVVAREKVNDIAEAFRLDHERGKPGSKYVEPYTEAQLALGSMCDKLKLQVSKAARGA